MITCISCCSLFLLMGLSCCISLTRAWGEARRSTHWDTLPPWPRVAEARQCFGGKISSPGLRAAYLFQVAHQHRCDQKKQADGDGRFNPDPEASLATSDVASSSTEGAASSGTTAPSSFASQPLASDAEVGGGDALFSSWPALPSMPSCPVTQEPMRDPVVAADGHTYERSGRHVLEHEPPERTQPANELDVLGVLRCALVLPAFLSRRRAASSAGAAARWKWWAREAFLRAQARPCQARLAGGAGALPPVGRGPHGPGGERKVVVALRAEACLRFI
jgi:hypothetical protein